MINQALIYFHDSDTIKNMFLKIKSKDRDEFKSFILDILIDNCDKLILAYQEGWIDYYIWRIISNQYYSNTSPWYRKHIIKDYYETDIPDIIDEEVNDVDLEKIIIEVKTIIRKMHWYDRTLFEMYYFDKMTYKKIESETGINYIAVRRSVMKTLQNVKKQLKVK